MRKPKTRDIDPMLQEMKKIQRSKLKENEALKNLLTALNKNTPAKSKPAAENEHADKSAGNTGNQN